MSDRKYRQHGYQDSGEKPQKSFSPQGPARKDNTYGPRPVQMPGTHSVSRCAQCGALLTSLSEPLGQCPKCAFIFLALTPFVERAKLEAIFHGKNLLLDSQLEPIYRQLLGIEGDKPLECVGEIKENRAAMRLAQQSYPELSKYEFELPTDYDYKVLADQHSMPDTMYAMLLDHVRRFDD